VNSILKPTLSTLYKQRHEAANEMLDNTLSAEVCCGQACTDATNRLMIPRTDTPNNHNNTKLDTYITITIYSLGPDVEKRIARRKRAIFDREHDLRTRPKCTVPSTHISELELNTKCTANFGQMPTVVIGVDKLMHACLSHKYMKH
jgi:hypothetical protein